MPELPEVESLVQFLDNHLQGQTIAKVELAAISALKTFDPPLDALRGRDVAGVRRRGKYLLFETATTGTSDALWLVLHLARGGWVRWRDEVSTSLVKPGKGPLALRTRLATGAGFEVTEAGTEKRLAVWIVRSPDEVEPLARLGPDALDPAFDVDALEAALANGTTLKGALTDQEAIAGIGNAYSDEVLHAARLSPFKPAAKLTRPELQRLFDALVQVLTDAVERSEGLPAAGLKAEKRAGMRVHGRTGEPCPVCGDLVRQVAFATKSLQYCPTCQTGGRPLADRRLSRLLK
ncbi:MAG TPA: DNA-formamidopyrimidine glycosylase family protein [Acidimicrobiales bacterium]